MDFKTALGKAQAFRGSKVAAVGDCGDRWLFSFENDINKLGGLPVFVFKDSGDCEFVAAADYAESLISGAITYTPMNLPEEPADE